MSNLSVMTVLKEFAFKRAPFGNTTEAVKQYNAAYIAITELVEAAQEVEADAAVLGMSTSRLTAAIAAVRGTK